MLPLIHGLVIAGMYVLMFMFLMFCFLFLLLVLSYRKITQSTQNVLVAESVPYK